MIARARLVFCATGPSVSAPRGLDDLIAEFPSLEIAVAHDRADVGDATVDASAWRSMKCDLYAFDRRVACLDEGEESPKTLDIRGQPSTGAATAVEILTRYQRMIPRRNAVSRGALFDRVLRRHRTLTGQRRSLARVECEHALDVWHWMLRLDPQASFAAQVAAIFHNVERLTSSSAALREPHGVDSPAEEADEAEQARGSARLTAELLEELGVSDATRAASVALITERAPPRHAESPPGAAHTRAATTLGDADALSFFSLGSPEFVDRHGLDQGEKKIRYTLARMSPRARARLGRVRLRSDVAHMLLIALAAERASGGRDPQDE